MSALSEIQQTPARFGVRAVPIDLHQVAPLFWAWYRANPDRKIWTLKVWIINKTFTVKDLRPVFEALFGPEQ